MIKAAAAALTLITAGCITVMPPAGPPPGLACDAASAQHLVGRSATGALAAEAQRLTGARVVRWLQPGQIVTMEYRADRLNIETANGRVVAIRCG